MVAPPRRRDLSADDQEWINNNIGATGAALLAGSVPSQRAVDLAASMAVLKGCTEAQVRGGTNREAALDLCANSVLTPQLPAWHAERDSQIQGDKNAVSNGAAIGEDGENAGLPLNVGSASNAVPIQSCGSNVSDAVVPVMSVQSNQCVNAPIVDHPADGTPGVNLAPAEEAGGEDDKERLRKEEQDREEKDKDSD
jgi:hypothetical protein